jgi:hypothetical protein
MIFQRSLEICNTFNKIYVGIQYTINLTAIPCCKAITMDYKKKLNKTNDNLETNLLRQSDEHLMLSPLYHNV